MMILQISAAIVTLVIGLFNINKEVRPVIQKHLYQSKNTWQWTYKGYDNNFQYYSDPSGYYWCRVNKNGICEYATNPNYQVANSTQGIIR